MSLWDRLQEVVPHTGRAWLEAAGIAVVLVVLIFVVLPRLVKPRVARWAIAAVLVLVAGWLTVLPVFFDKRVDERLLSATSNTIPSSPTPPSVGPPPSGPPSTDVAPTKVATGPLKGLAGHFGRGAASIYRLADGNFFVRLEEIETPRAPAVYVYLVPRPGQTGPEGALDLGALKGNQGEPELRGAGGYRHFQVPDGPLVVPALLHARGWRHPDCGLEARPR